MCEEKNNNSHLYENQIKCIVKTWSWQVSKNVFKLTWVGKSQKVKSN